MFSAVALGSLLDYIGANELMSLSIAEGEEGSGRRAHVQVFLPTVELFGRAANSLLLQFPGTR